jgi:hypothetical protein
LVIVILLFAVASVSAAEYQVHEGEPIQAVINMANPGDTIIVHNTIKLTLAGYQDWIKRVHVTAGETAQIHATLSKASGAISVTSTPSGAGISFDGRPINAITPYTIPNVEPGYHNIKLSLTGYQDGTKKYMWLRAKQHIYMQH